MERDWIWGYKFFFFISFLFRLISTPFCMSFVCLAVGIGGFLFGKLFLIPQVLVDLTRGKRILTIESL